MSTSAKPQQATNPAPRPAAAPVKKPTKSFLPKTEQTFLFDRDNYIWMIVGVAFIFIGFLMMCGGKSANPHEFHYDEIYSFRRITLSPIIILMGFVIEVFAIMKKPKEVAQA